MRYLPWLASLVLTTAISLAFASTANARLFWQTYGSTVPMADGYGSTWNSNQDYFVPRHTSSGRYGLFSPCKSSRTTSPACKWSHPWYSGYCSIYGPCHYRRRNHVYGEYCGSTSIQASVGRVKRCGGYGAATSCCAAPETRGSCSVAGCGGVCFENEAPFYNVERGRVAILGSIPVEDGNLLSQTDFTQLGAGQGGQLLPQPRGLLPQLQRVPSLNLPQLTQPLAK